MADAPELQSLLVREKVEAARRAMLLYPQQLSWNWWDDVTVELRFWLPAGSFATSVVRNLSTRRVIMRILLSNDDGIHAPVFRRWRNTSANLRMCRSWLPIVTAVARLIH